MTARTPAPNPKRRRRWVRVALLVAAVGAAGLAIALLFARSALLRRARNEGVDVQQLRWNELEARTANRAIPGGLGRLHAIGVKARWSPAPLLVEVEHLDYQAPDARLKQKPGDAASSNPAGGIARDPRARTRKIPSWARDWLDAQDWDIKIKHGPSLELGPREGDKQSGPAPETNALALKDIHIKRRSGEIDLNAKLVLPDQVAAPLHCKPRAPLSWSSIHLECKAPEFFDAPIKLDIARQERHLDLKLTHGERSVKLVRDRKKNTWHLDAKQFPALWWKAATKAFSLPSLAMLRLQDNAQLNVRLDLDAPKAPDHTRRLSLHQFEVQGVELQDRYIGPESVRLPKIEASGTMQVALRQRKSSRGELDLRLGELDLKAAWEFTPTRHHLSLAAPEQPCMRWLETIPAAMRPELAGMTLKGQSAASIELSYDPQKRAAFDEDKPESKPGSVTLNFPLFETCEVLTEPTLLSQAPVQDSGYEHPWPKANPAKAPRLMGSKGKEFVSLNRMPWFSKAMTVTEDPNYWEHKGFDTEAMEKALWYNLAKLRVARGASTISQQCARMLWLGTQRNLTRKVQEMVLTWRLESTVSKRRILELYLNLIELGPSLYGGPDAARFYFDRSITQLNLKESLFLATLAPAPSRLSKTSESGKIPSAWNDNLRRQIERLRIRGWITSDQAQDAIIAPLRLKDRSEAKKP